MIKYALPASLIFSISAFAQPHVVTSIKPVSMIVTAIGGDHVDVEQLVTNQASPHDFAMRPSDLRKLNDADLVVWVGDSLETFLAKPLANLKHQKDIEWMAQEGTFLREFGDESLHDHPGHDHSHADHDDHDDHDHEEHGHDHEDHDHDHDHEEHGHEHEDHDHDHEEHEHDHEEQGHAGHHHDHTGTDPHVWLDPVNAEVLAEAVAKRLSKIDPDHKQEYQHHTSESLVDRSWALSHQ